MASNCISSCVDDARVPVRATYVNLYKWPESDFEFVRSMSSKATPRNDCRSSIYGHPRVVDSISCRQLYLRSYTFSREEDHADEKTVKCLGRAKNKAADDGSKKRMSGGGRRRGDVGRRKREGMSRAKGRVSCSVLGSIFRRLLSCTTKIDVVN